MSPSTESPPGAPLPAPLAWPDEDLARRLWTLGDVVRLRLLRLLPDTPECAHGNNVSQLAVKLGLAQPTVSHHLRILRSMELVESRRMCRDVFYWVNRAAVERVAAGLLQVIPGEEPPPTAGPGLR